MSWEFRVGGGVLVSHVSEADNTLTDDNAVFLYPDLKTLIAGRFDKGRLMKGHAAVIISVDYVNGIPVPRPGQLARDLYTLDESTKREMTPKLGLHLNDPYETQHLEVKDSGIRGAGRGVFAAKDAAAGTVLGFYNGVRMSNFESKLRRADRNSPYRMDNDWAKPGQILNVPEGYREPRQYSASLGHLVNHGKKGKVNAKFEMFDHPRFGKVKSVVAVKDIR